MHFMETSPWRLEILTLQPLLHLVLQPAWLPQHLCREVLPSFPRLELSRIRCYCYFSFKKGKQVNGGEDIWKRDKYPSGVSPVLTAE